MLAHDNMSRKYFFPRLTLDIWSWSRGSSSPFVMHDLGRHASLIICNTSSEAEGLPSEVRIEDDSNRSQKWKPLFSTVHITLIIMRRKYIFGFSKFISFQVGIPISKSPSHPWYMILDSRVPPCNAISEGMPPLCSASTVVGVLPSEIRINYQGWLGPKIV